MTPKLGVLSPRPIVLPGLSVKAQVVEEEEVEA